MRPFLRLLFPGITLLLLAACVHPGAAPAERQIRERIALIRESILARNAEGIVRHGTPDWSFITPDGARVDRTGFIERTRRLFANSEIESLQTDIFAVSVHGERANVQLRQQMVRTEKDAAGQSQRWRVTYREGQEWVRTTEGWCVARVEVYSPTREALPLR